MELVNRQGIIKLMSNYKARIFHLYFLYFLFFNFNLFFIIFIFRFYISLQLTQFIQPLLKIELIIFFQWWIPRNWKVYIFIIKSISFNLILILFLFIFSLFFILYFIAKEYFQVFLDEFQKFILLHFS